MYNIKLFYELHVESITDILEDFSNEEYYQGCGRVEFNSACGVNSIEKFSKSI
jgi:hypothetical protein